MAHKDMYSGASKSVMQQSYRLAAEMGHKFVGSEHMLWSLARKGTGPASQVLIDAGLDHELVRELIEKYDGVPGPGSNPVQGLTPDAGRVIELAEAQARKLGHKQVDPEHILLGMLEEPNCNAARLITATGVPLDRLVSGTLAMIGNGWPREQSGKEGGPKQTKTLDKYSNDLTEAAAQGKLDPVIGRETEIQRAIQILSRRTKNNPVLIGEPGVGKTAIAEGLAQRITAGDIPDNLTGKRLVSLDLTKMLSGAKFRGDFEERIKNTIDEASSAGNVILFIDELHTLIGAGASEGSMDAANILKPALSRGELQVIGATTLGEYRKHIEKDAALERRFQSIMVDEPDHEDSVTILTGLRPKYEEFHKLAITDEAIRAAVSLSARYIQDRYLPDKAIDLIDEAASRVRTRKLAVPQELRDMERAITNLNKDKVEAVQKQDYELAAVIRDRQAYMRKEMEEKKARWRSEQNSAVGAEDIAEVVSSWTGIPVTMLTEDEAERLLRLEDTLHQRVVGQDEAVKAVSKAIRRGRVGLKDPRRPAGNFLFLGPTGVGKTELCRTLASTLFQDGDAMIRVDMSEYMERHTVSKLIGSPPGYVGYDEGGQLTEKVRRKPYSVILFDEIEKAHPDVWSILLQIMEDGHLTDAQGRRVDFKNTIIVMTSNAGAKDITDNRKTLGFSAASSGERGTKSQSEIRERVMEEVKRTFKPEFLNRIDDIIVFHQLTRENVHAIAGIMLRDLEKRMADIGIGLSLDESALDLLVEEGFDPIYGARPLRRVIQSKIEDLASEKILEGAFRAGDRMVVTAREGQIEIGKAPQEHKEPELLSMPQQ